MKKKDKKLIQMLNLQNSEDYTIQIVALHNCSSPQMFILRNGGYNKELIG